MPPRYRVILSPRARSDLAGIYAYIKTDSPQNAMKVSERLMAATESLEYFPHRFARYFGARKMPDEVRRMPSYPFLIY